MDAREQLRRYLEQRQEMGENELLLDSMSVDDVMKAIGAINAGSKASVSAAGADWREALREEPQVEGLKAPEDSSELFDDDIMRLTSLKSIENAVAKCTRCRLYKTATNPVPGEGSPKAKLVCVGEAPGANEDATGRPFVGQAVAPVGN